MLYRGVCARIHESLGGEIWPAGEKKEVTPLYDGTAEHDGRFTYGVSEENAVRAQHIASGTYNNCFVSTSRDREVAFKCATTEMVGDVRHPSDGVIYWIDENACSDNGVVLFDVGSPLHPEEAETSIRAKDCGQIPAAVVVNVEHVYFPVEPPTQP